MRPVSHSCAFYESLELELFPFPGCVLTPLVPLATTGRGLTAWALSAYSGPPPRVVVVILGLVG